MPESPRQQTGASAPEAGWIPRLRHRLGANRLVLSLSFARLADGVGNSVLIVTLPLYVAQLPSPLFHLPQSLLVGVLIGLYGLVNAAAQPLMGAWSDRIERRKIFILGGLALMGGGTLALLLAGRFLHLLLLRSLQGVGFAMTLPASLAILRAATTRSSRGAAMGIFTTFRMIGFSIGPLLGGFLQSRFGFAAAFWAGGAFILAAIATVGIWVEEPARRATPRAAEPHASAARGLRYGLLGLGFATFVMALTIAMMAALENEFNARLHQTAFGFGIAFSALTLTRVASQVPLGSLSDRIGRKPLVIAGLILLAPATVALAMVGSTLHLVFARLAQGLASAAIAAPAFALAADLAPGESAGRQMSVLTMGFALGIAAGPLLAGALATVGFVLPFWLAGGFALVAAAIVWRRVPETVDRHTPPRDELGALE